VLGFAWPSAGDAGSIPEPEALNWNLSWLARRRAGRCRRPRPTNGPSASARAAPRLRGALEVPNSPLQVEVTEPS
jgi:hypothetical protein